MAAGRLDRACVACPVGGLTGWRSVPLVVALPSLSGLARGPQDPPVPQKSLLGPELSRYDQTIHVQTYLRARRRHAGTLMPAPEATARQLIDRCLKESGWAVLDIADTNLGALARGGDSRVPAHLRAWFCRLCALCRRPGRGCDRGQEGWNDPHRRRAPGRPVQRRLPRRLPGAPSPAPFSVPEKKQRPPCGFWDGA